MHCSKKINPRTYEKKLMPRVSNQQMRKISTYDAIKKSLSEHIKVSYISHLKSTNEKKIIDDNNKTNSQYMTGQRNVILASPQITYLHDTSQIKGSK